MIRGTRIGAMPNECLNTVKIRILDTGLLMDVSRTGVDSRGPEGTPRDSIDREKRRGIVPVTIF